MADDAIDDETSGAAQADGYYGDDELDDEELDLSFLDEDESDEDKDDGPVGGQSTDSSGK